MDRFVGSTRAASATASSTTALGPIRIEIGGPGSKSYKSIKHIIWDNIPAFAVLTGLNGSGKTQLLEILAYRLTNTWHNALGDLRGVPISVTGDKFGPDEVAFIQSGWDIDERTIGIDGIRSAKHSLFESLREYQVRHNLPRQALRARLERLLNVTNLEAMGVEEFVRRTPNDYTFMLDEVDVISGLTHVFVAYRLKAAEALEEGKAHADLPDILGPAPWNVLNEILEVAEFSYRVVSPVGTKLTDMYQILLEDLYTKQRLSPSDLSSGEKIMLALVFWLYNSQQHGRFPRLFLLDEPDAHLHPSMTRHLLQVLKEVLVERYQVRTILTTHSPSTVALAPTDAVFEISRAQVHIRRSASQEATIGSLTAGLVTVSRSTRYVLVEDEEDVTFYNAIRDILTDYGPSRDMRAIKPAPSIVFLPASTGSGKAKVSGGRHVVQGWVDKFNQPPLNTLVYGIIDRDESNQPMARVQVLSRYSIENYYLDPFVVFGLLVEMGVAPAIDQLSISPGDEHRIRSLDDVGLGAIMNVIREAIEPKLTIKKGTIDTIERKVTFTNGRSVEYPAWMTNCRGRDLLPVYQDLYGGADKIHPGNLERSLRKTRLIPVELADIFDHLQA